MKKIILICFITVLSLQPSFAEGIGIGFSGAYNFQTESFGAGFRLNIKPSNRFRIVPQVAYFPSFNKIHDLYAGLSLELTVLKIKSFDFYVLGHGAYNAWLNWEESNLDNAKQTNWTAEFGVGLVSNKGCVRPFVEYKYNLMWKETNLHLGVLFVFGCGKNSRYKNLRNRRNRPVSCPAYN